MNDKPICFMCECALHEVPGPFCSISCGVSAVAKGVPGALYSGVFEEPHQLHPRERTFAEWERS